MDVTRHTGPDLTVTLQFILLAFAKTILVLHEESWKHNTLIVFETDACHKLQLLLTCVGPPCSQRCSPCSDSRPSGYI